MNVPIWVLWCFALLLAAMPVTTLLIARSVDKVRPKRRRAKHPVFVSDAVCDGVLVFVEEEELVRFASRLAQEQMRIRWGKDIAFID